MPFRVTIDRPRVLDAQKAFGRLRTLLRQQPVSVVDVLAQARECGRCAYRADMRLDMTIDVLAGLPLPDAFRTGSLPEQMTDAAVEAYLVAAEQVTELATA